MATEDRTAALEESLLQGARGVQNSTENMLERLAKTFTATDLVTIKNILPDPFGWVYTDPRETTVEQPDTATRRVNFGAPKAHSLDPGATKTIPGWEAYIALERMWKAYAQIDIERISFVLTSVQEMDSFLAQAYVGTFDPDSVGGAGGNKALGFEPAAPAPVMNTTADRTAVAESTVVTPPVLPPTEDPNLGFSNEQDHTVKPPVIPPLQEANQLPPELGGGDQSSQPPQGTGNPPVIPGFNQ